MKIKQLYLWQMKTVKNVYLVFFAIMLLIFALATTIVAVTAAAGTLQFPEQNTINIQSSIIFVAILAMLLFVVSFKFAISIGVSRKTLMIAQICSIISLSAIAALGDALLLFASQGVINLISFPVIFSTGLISGGAQSLGAGLGHIGATFGIYLLIATIGFFISALNNRMNKVTRLFVFVGVPTAITLISLLLGFLLPPDTLSALLRFAGEAFNVMFKTTARTMLSCIILTAGFSSLTFLCVRRAPLNVQ